MNLLKLNIVILILLISSFGHAQTEYAKQYFSVARDHWIESMNYENVSLLIDLAESFARIDVTKPEKIELLKKMAAQARQNNEKDQVLATPTHRGAEVLSDNYNFIVELRESAQLLRTTEKFMDLRHQPTGLLSDFTIALGDFKDSLRVPDPETAKIQQKKQARHLLEAIAQTNLRALADDFTPADNENIRNYMSLRLQELKSRVSDPQDEFTISPEGKLMLHDNAYHAIRKEMRDFYLLFQVQNMQFADYSGAKAKEALKKQKKVISKMGKKHDALVQSTMGNKAGREDVYLAVPQSAAKVSESIAKRMEKTMPGEESDCAKLLRGNSTSP